MVVIRHALLLHCLLEHYVLIGHYASSSLGVAHAPDVSVVIVEEHLLIGHWLLPWVEVDSRRVILVVPLACLLIVQDPVRRAVHLELLRILLLVL